MALGLAFNVAFLGCLLVGVSLLLGLFVYPALFDEAYFGQCEGCASDFPDVLWWLPVATLAVSVACALP
jgi:hypothetical protein